MHLSRVTLVALIALGGFTARALADYFVWQDPKSGVSLSYPDTWKMVNQRQPDEVLTIMAPSSEGDDAICRVRVRDDHRFLIYPPHLGRDVQTISYNQAFWEEYLGEYDNIELYGIIEGSGLGRGYGSFAVSGYDAAMFTPMSRRRGIAASSLYFDKAYIVDCSAQAAAFEKWQPLFYSIIGSVDFKKTHDEVWAGDYRNFFTEPRLEFEWPTNGRWPGTGAVTRY